MHILIIPRKHVPVSLDMDFDTAREAVFAAKKLAARYGDADRYLVLCINGGRRQEVAQAHFHLFAPEKGSDREARHDFAIEPAREGESSAAFFERLKSTISELDSRFDIVKKGFSVKLVKFPGAREFDGCVYIDWK